MQGAPLARECLCKGLGCKGLGCKAPLGPDSQAEANDGFRSSPSSLSLKVLQSASEMQHWVVCGRNVRRGLGYKSLGSSSSSGSSSIRSSDTVFCLIKGAISMKQRPLASCLWPLLHACHPAPGLRHPSGIPPASLRHPCRPRTLLVALLPRATLRPDSSTD